MSNPDAHLELMLERVNTHVQSTNDHDFTIQSLTANELILVGSFDLAYYHHVELRFTEVTYVNLPTWFNEPRFSIAKPGEVLALQQSLYVEPEDTVFRVRVDDQRGPFYIVAEACQLIEGISYHYLRENLKPGERIAEWVIPAAER